MHKDVERGRSAFEADAWSEAAARLTAADAHTPLEPDDLDRLATAAFLIGDEAASDEARTRAHTAWLARGETIRAARSAFWLAFALVERHGQQARASGWVARARRLLETIDEACAEHGLVRCLLAYDRVRSGDIAGALAGFGEAAAIGAACGDRDLVALARHGEGRALVLLGRRAEGFATLDEVMVSVTCGEVTPMVTGVVYCSVLSACVDVFDMRRAQEWTRALSEWCAAHPDMVPFRGQCLVRRSQLMRLHGAWPAAMQEAGRACEILAGESRDPAVAAAHYERAELHRVRGAFAQAEAAYRDAIQAGSRAQPGLALLRLAQGQVEAACAAIHREIDAAAKLPARAHVLQAGVEIMLANADLDGARAAAGEQMRLAAALDAPYLRAAAAHGSGAVALAAGDAVAAAAALREALVMWRDLDAPYEMARVRERLAHAYRALGDQEGARMELEAAAELFEALGAATDAARTVAALDPGRARPAGALTGRELEVLRLIATGRTNRAIAAELSISEKTVARHISNIFTKLDLPSRSAATAYAYDHHLV